MEHDKIGKGYELHPFQNAKSFDKTTDQKLAF